MDFHLNDLYKFVFNESNIERFEEVSVNSAQSICKTIIENDLKAFISCTEVDEFEKNQIITTDEYSGSIEEYTVLELCCYHGADDCFKFLRSKYKPRITKNVFNFHFWVEIRI